MGGHTVDPTYREICTGKTGHAEVIQITYDDEIISLAQLLEVFWTAHDPTTLNRQGNDRGTQYRSVIFYSYDEEKDIAERSIDQVASSLYDDPVVTELSPMSKFYPAERYHQNYYNNNGTNPYCGVVISPKVSKLRAKHAHLLKSETSEA